MKSGPRTSEPPVGPKKRDAPWSPSICKLPDASPGLLNASKLFTRSASSSSIESSSSNVSGFMSRGWACCESIDCTMASASSSECIRSSIFVILRRRWSSAASTNLIMAQVSEARYDRLCILDVPTAIARRNGFYKYER